MVLIFIGFLVTVRSLRAEAARRSAGRLLREVCELQPAAHAMN
jgi:hypothetical protein